MRCHKVNFVVVEVNLSSETSAIQKVLHEISTISTVPILFVDGKSIGGCNYTKMLEFRGDLVRPLASYMHSLRGDVEAGADTTQEVQALPEPDVEVLQSTLFYFPDVVNNHIVQITGLLTATIAILCTIFYHNPVTPWVVLALAIDFFLRFIYGSTHSLLGTIANAIAVFVGAPVWTAGPPKQFAALVGTGFATFAAGLFLGHQPVGGAVVIALLAGMFERRCFF